MKALIYARERNLCVSMYASLANMIEQVYPEIFVSKINNMQVKSSIFEILKVLLK